MGVGRDCDCFGEGCCPVGALEGVSFVYSRRERAVRAVVGRGYDEMGSDSMRVFMHKTSKVQVGIKFGEGGVSTLVSHECGNHLAHTSLNEKR